MKPIRSPVAIECIWIEGDKRRDLDNVAADIKFVLDGMIDAGILVDDSQKWVKAISHTVATKKGYYGLVAKFIYS
jgi:Holliday junction resolvase RusA-like endonuclease